MVKKVLACCAFGDADKDTLIEFTKHLKNQDYKSLDITFVDFSENQTLSNELRKTGAAVIPLNKNLNSSQSKPIKDKISDVSFSKSFKIAINIWSGVISLHANLSDSL